MNQNKKTVVIDVDCTVVDTPLLWYNWLTHVTGTFIGYDDVSKYYDFSVPFKEVLQEKGIDGYDFWRSETLYDSVSPVPYSVEAVEGLKEKGYNIVFCSAIKGNHHKSKHRWLRKNFPSMDALVATKEKWAIKADVVIDDRHLFLNMFDDNIIKIKRTTPYEQCCDLDKEPDYQFRSWKDFIDKILPKL
jgi:5'(3')-deoxyribonucleotidase